MAVAETRGMRRRRDSSRIEQAEQTIRKGSDNQIDRARVLEVRIQSPPADSPSLSTFRLRYWKSPGFPPV